MDDDTKYKLIELVWQNYPIDPCYGCSDEQYGREEGRSDLAEDIMLDVLNMTWTEVKAYWIARYKTECAKLGQEPRADVLTYMENRKR